jgi:hypothetical protein
MYHCPSIGNESIQAYHMRLSIVRLTSGKRRRSYSELFKIFPNRQKLGSAKKPRVFHTNKIFSVGVVSNSLTQNKKFSMIHHMISFTYHAITVIGNCRSNSKYTVMLESFFSRQMALYVLILN